MKAAIRRAKRAAAEKSASRWVSRETASEGIPWIAASVAADTVPEYRTLIPTLAPRLIPETTRSTGPPASSQMPILTQSAGVPADGIAQEIPVLPGLPDHQRPGDRDRVADGALFDLGRNDDAFRIL